MKLDIFTLCYNESKNIPYVVDYWKKIIDEGIDLHVTVYDNHSTDNSVELLSQYDWITVKYFESDGCNDLIHQKVKDMAWRESKADLIMVCDFDEIIWSKNLKEELQKFLDSDCNLLVTKWYAFCGEEEPEYDEGKYLHQLVKRGYKQYINHTKGFADYGKFLVFKPVEDIKWSVGQHILFSMKPYCKPYYTDKIVMFHICRGYSEDYFVERTKKQGERLSETNRRYGMGVEYNWEEQKQREEYIKHIRESIDISEL